MRRSRLWVPVAAACVLAVVAGLYVAAPHRGGDGMLGTIVAAEPPPAAAPAAGGDAPPPRPAAAEHRVESQPPRAIDAEWERRSVPATLVRDRALVAIVIDDIGTDRNRALRAIGLPAPLTLSFLPYGRDAPALAVIARQRGHEILLHMPMQPLGGENPGPQALTADLAAVEIRARVGAALDRFGDAVGLNNHMGSRFTADRRLLGPVAEELAARGLIFVDSRTTAASQVPQAAEDFGIPTAVRDVFLDNDPSPEAVRAQFEELERVARRRRQAIAIGHPHDATLAALAAWLPLAAERGIQVVPVTAIVRRGLERASARP
jgi:polysaccharide deacetylase 2 family uncharacterized protein YibQ